MRPKAQAFHFRGYAYTAQRRSFSFTYEITFSDRKPLTFTERVILPKAPSQKLDHETLRKFLEPLHLILGISYYKLYCPPKVTLPFKLSKEQAEFWNSVYRKGLGEFLYRNRLDPQHVARFPYSTVKTAAAPVGQFEKILLGIGGGKDSIVSAELLHEFDVTSFHIETRRKDATAKAVIQKIGNPSLQLRRILDPKILQKHEGGYTGHIPISAIFAFLGLLSAALYKYRYVIVSNEQSSNFGNTRYRGDMINHQWSKSAEFEALLQNYTRKFITPDIVYFSLLRQLYEIRIAELFARHTKYHSLFSSCNRSSASAKTTPNTRWCGACPKCAFVFLILAPFLPKKKLISIFGKNLFEDKTLLLTYKNTLGFGNYKPFDCVGTFEESRAALYLAAKHFKESLVVKTFLPQIRNGRALITEVFKTQPAPTTPASFRLLGIKTVCIIGYDVEGKATEKYLRKKYPHLKIGILDQKFDKNYLTKQDHYDLALKTPGIPKYKITIPYTTATNIFFAENKNFTIGVTGTKGKSTTVSLIYAMLRAAGKKVRLVGNIGNPMLATLLTRINPKEIFVIELSSYMLDDIDYSPNIALLLNLFPDHMTYHGGLGNYYAAKKNIFRFQSSQDIAIVAPFNAKIPLKKSDIPLIGDHNMQNIRAAIKVVRQLGISDAAIRKGIKNFKPLPHRLENIGTFKGITFYDDAISTTPDSTIMAIKALKKVDTIFLGGEDRGYDFARLEKTVRKYKIRNIVLFPDTGKRMLKSQKGLRVFETRSIERAIAFAYKYTQPGSICLLSTASPSYSLWKNFIEKGNEFKKYAKMLGGK